MFLRVTQRKDIILEYKIEELLFDDTELCQLKNFILSINTVGNTENSWTI